ncbi:hypothetical protein VQ02_24210 [Methylobacterium variabile]|uniref:Uncharacterized protein n=1 Tax=Methylobacterium variabile TaxID=298794 RepID=A0A0J6SAF1_9HYPH|nr:hypothetical protein [Methylobacterium variabile]KMO32190.1 hypothetical protein VQ02_24210 [Methylobacterium variabile]
MTTRHLLPVLLLLASTGAATAQDHGRPAAKDDAYAYAGSHAGGPADALIPNGVPLPVHRRSVDPAYAQSGSHAGGPADALIPDGTPVPVTRRVVDPAYRYSGSHAGGPADALIPE